MLVVYLSHPLGEEDSSDRGDNISNALEWFRFFVGHTRWALTAPWYPYAIALRETIYGERQLVDQLRIMERCDILVLCGGWISPHMHEEIKRAHRLGIPVLDLTMMGVRPPDDNTEDVAQLIVHRARRTIVGRPRRVWIPLLTIYDVEALKDARHSLYSHMPGEHEAAVRIVDRIISAALEEVS